MNSFHCNFLSRSCRPRWSFLFSFPPLFTRILKSSTVSRLSVFLLCVSYLLTFIMRGYSFLWWSSATSDIANVVCLHHSTTRAYGLAMHYPSETATASPLLAYPPSPPLPVGGSVFNDKSHRPVRDTHQRPHRLDHRTCTYDHTQAVHTFRL
jgi:hypothetical protein